MKNISSSSQDYIEAILELSKENESVRSVDIAKKLLVSRASVNRAIGVLKDAGFVKQERYSDISLTEDGRSVAKEVIETHNTLKTFLVDILGVDLQTAEKDACKMEHNISGETLLKLKKFIDHIKE